MALREKTRGKRKAGGEERLTTHDARVKRGHGNDAKTRPSQPTEVKDADDPLPPPFWPRDVHFLHWHSQPSTKLSALHHLEFCIAPPIDDAHHPTQIRRQGWTIVYPITNATAFKPAYGSTLTHHPAVGQYGLFAKRDIPPRTLVVPYLGWVHLAGDESADEDPTSQYDAAVGEASSDGVRLGIDATRMGSEARFVNDYRGILVRPNLFFDQWSAPFPHQSLCVHRDVARKTASDLGTSLQTVKGLALYSGAHPIKAGTELCASYGKGWWAARRTDTNTTM